MIIAGGAAGGVLLLAVAALWLRRQEGQEEARRLSKRLVRRSCRNRAGRNTADQLEEQDGVQAGGAGCAAA